MIMFPRALLERAYARRLRRALTSVPRHVAIVTDGNPGHVSKVLTWCGEVGISCVTVYAAAVSEPRGAEVDHLTLLISEVCRTRPGQPSSRWRLRVAGRVDVLPDATRTALKEAEEATRGRPWTLTVAIGYDGRAEVVEAVRRQLSEAAALGETPSTLAARFDPADIDVHLWVSGLPDTDLVIRTSGERRMSGFLLWQSAFSELYFCDVYWPGFRKIDFLRALRAYAGRMAAVD
ncbi:polyprenyl diphosphate synthase [Asanoa siamensis]|uniref:Short-chain Z-isoprenyl diphosphate synthase n=1 Tax=Asanoa siamensis TaxID=926357 RepID=A0ABQ4D368_9ACTN|nr:polyprenyl diphosphate synthase [Asanoa siamensis]GIF77949.1 short-chain Z-isoprenyl diphosphate synthase [Asanoa siamensis]